jgi:hypothetical protein
LEVFSGWGKKFWILSGWLNKLGIFSGWRKELGFYKCLYGLSPVGPNLDVKKVEEEGWEIGKAKCGSRPRRPPAAKAKADWENE